MARGVRVRGTASRVDTSGLQKFAVIKVTRCVKYRLKLWRVGMEGMERMGGVAGEGSGVVDSDRGKVIKWR